MAYAVCLRLGTAPAAHRGEKATPSQGFRVPPPPPLHFRSSGGNTRGKRRGREPAVCRQPSPLFSSNTATCSSSTLGSSDLATLLLPIIKDGPPLSITKRHVSPSREKTSVAPNISLPLSVFIVHTMFSFFIKFQKTLTSVSPAATCRGGALQSCTLVGAAG